MHYSSDYHFLLIDLADVELKDRLPGGGKDIAGLVVELVLLALVVVAVVS